MNQRTKHIIKGVIPPLFLPALSSLALAVVLMIVSMKVEEQPVLSPLYPLVYDLPEPALLEAPVMHDTLIVERSVVVEDYFDYLDSLIVRYDETVCYPISEHLIVWANPWIIDSLEATDYYRQQERGNFLYDQTQAEILKPGDTLYIPAAALAEDILRVMDDITIDVNIPEFRLRILYRNDTIHSFPVRVGQNRSRFLAMSGRITDMRTAIGVGEVVRIEKDPLFINPKDNKRYQVTRRDDGQVTKMPRIPWIEPELNGIRPGHLMHPTTNPASLGKAYSNGCIGLGEADSWRLYYYAPLGTRVVYRYDLEVLDQDGETITLPDIYGYGKKQGA